MAVEPQRSDQEIASLMSDAMIESARKRALVDTTWMF